MPFLGLPTRVTPPTPVEKRACSDSPYLCKSAISKVWWGIFWCQSVRSFWTGFRSLRSFRPRLLLFQKRSVATGWLRQLLTAPSLHPPRYAMGRNKPAPRTSFLMYPVRRIGLRKAAIDLVSFESSQLNSRLVVQKCAKPQESHKIQRRCCL